MEEAKESSDDTGHGSPLARAASDGANSSSAHSSQPIAATSSDHAASAHHSISQPGQNPADKSRDAGGRSSSSADSEEIDQPSAETAASASSPAEQRQQQQEMAVRQTKAFNVSKPMSKRTKHAEAAGSQPKQRRAEKAAAAGAAEPARAPKKRDRSAADVADDVMVAIVGKEKHRGQWRWKVQWQSGAEVS